MIEPVIGMIGGSGLYDIDGLEDKVVASGGHAMGHAVRCAAVRPLGGVRCVFLPRHGRGHPLSPTHLNYRANIDALKRSGVTDVLSLSAVGSLQAGPAARALRHRRPVHRPQLRAREELLRRRHRGACVDGASGLLAARRRAGRRGARARPAGDPRRHLSGHGRAAVLHQGRERAVSLLGLQRDRHDQHAGGEARARGGAELRHRGDGDRLRLLASGPRPRHGRGGGARAARQRRQGARTGAARRAGDRQAARRCARAGCDHALDNAIITASHMRDPQLAAKLDAVAGRVLRE